MPFKAKSARFSESIRLAGPIETVFPLFSPLGERSSVPDWDPELLHPPAVAWEAGLIFRTGEEMGDAVWIVTRLDRTAHDVEYHRVEPDRYVARVRVQCSAVAPSVTETTTTYEFVGLSESGNRQIEAMTPDAYAHKMASWTRWINEHLSRLPGER